MANGKQRKKTHRARHIKTTTERLLCGMRWMLGNAAYLLLAFAVVFVLGVLGIAGKNISAIQASGHGGYSTGHHFAPTLSKKTCGFAGLPACPTTQPQWIPIYGSGPGAILVAARKSRLFTINASGQGDTPNLSILGDAQLVRALRSPAMQSAADYEDIPILTATGATLGVVVCQLNPAHTALSVVEIVQYGTSRPAGTLAKITATAAITAVAQQRHTAVRPQTTPYLIYIPGTVQQQETGKIIWVVGGLTPDDPIWVIPCANGQSYAVGDDGHTYTISELPVGAAN